MPTPEERARRRTEALEHLSESLRALVPLVESQNERLEHLAPKTDLEQVRHEGRRNRRRTAAFILTVVLLLFTPLSIGTFYAIRSVGILKSATGAKAQKTQADVIAKIIADFDCSDETNLQEFYNKLVDQGVARPGVVFSQDNCVAARDAALKALEQDLGKASSSSTSTTPITPTTSTASTASTTPRPVVTSHETTSTSIHSTTTTTTVPSTTSTTSQPPSSTTTTTCVVNAQRRVCI